MGLYLCVDRADGTEEPTWDSTKHSHDRDFLKLIEDEGTTGHPDNNSEYCLFRFSDSNSIREKIKALGWDDYDRYDHLLKLTDSGCWFSISY